MSIPIIVAIGISLSMDAFSLSLSYGCYKISKKTVILLSVMVGLCHFFMSIIGCIIGEGLFRFFPLPIDLIVFIILTFIGLQMIIDSFSKQEIVKNSKFTTLLLFSFCVSFDSFSVGISLGQFDICILLASFIFLVLSSFFTILGLLIGSFLNKYIGKITTLIGGMILIIIGLTFILK